MKWFLAVFSVFLCVVIAVMGLKIKEEKSKKRFRTHISINRESFLQKVAAPAPDWMLRQIRKDLAPFAQNGVSVKMIDETMMAKGASKNGLVRFTVKNGDVSLSLAKRLLDSRHFRYILAAIVKLNELIPLPDVDFVMSDEDGFSNNPGNILCPVFTFSKAAGTEPFVLIPDCKALIGYDELRTEIAKANKEHSWASKRSKAFWRGGATGGPLTMDNWKTRARVQLVLLSFLMPHHLDARITSVKNDEFAKFFKAKGMMGKWVNKQDHLKYKYLVDVDGNACTFERYFWLLASNSVVLKQMTVNQQWYYGALEPYIHFIPIKEDFSDLMQQLDWAKTHDNEVKKIAQNATEFVNNHLSTEDIFLYLYHLIVEYSRIQR